VKLDENDRNKVVAEIADCQGRILQVFVPTIIAVGLISIADRQNIATITMVCAFVVMFGSSLYVANLSYKIFRNACFVRAVTTLAPKDGVVHWEEMLSRFNREQAPPAIIGYETRTIAFIYMIFAGAFFYMFREIDLLSSALFAAVLFAVALRMFLIPNAAERFHRQWVEILSET